MELILGNDELMFKRVAVLHELSRQSSSHAWLKLLRGTRAKFQKGCEVLLREELEKKKKQSGREEKKK